MKTKRISTWLGFGVLVMGLAPLSAWAQAGLEKVTGKLFDAAIPTNFYLEGNAIPTQKRNAAMVHTKEGARSLFALLDTSGYSSDVQTKYIGMIVTEGGLTVCAEKLPVGSYGFGWTRPATGSDQPGKLTLYNQAGAQVATCASQRDSALTQPRPLQVVTQNGTARLYYGRQFITLE